MNSGISLMPTTMSNRFMPLSRAIACCAIVLVAQEGVAQVLVAREPLISEGELLARVAARADSLTRNGSFAGTVVIAHGGKPIFERAYGIARREQAQPVILDTRMNVSSLGKLFTQAAVAQLVAAGKLDLSATIGRYWPDYPNEEARRLVTIQQLLDHRSGIGGDIFQKLTTLRKNSDYVPLFATLPLEFPPGSVSRYSNAGYVVLGEIVARVSGSGYYDFVKAHVFDIAGMTLTGFPALDSLPANSAYGYTREGLPPGSPLERNEPRQPRRGSSAGGSYSTAGDLLRLIVARRAGKLGPNVVTTQLAIIAGGSPGSNGMIGENLPGGYDVIALTNLDAPAAGLVVSAAAGWLGANVGRRVMMPALTPGGAATTVIPDTPAGRTLQAYIAAFNSGDTTVMRTFFETSAVPDPDRTVNQRVEFYRTLFAERGELRVASIQEASPVSLALTVAFSKSASTSMLFGVEATRPYRATQIAYQMSMSR